MKIPEGFQMPEATNSKRCSIYSIKLQRSLYQAIQIHVVQLLQ